jgi:hypothetical protein
MCVLLLLWLCLAQGKADDWRRSWSLKPSMAYELYIHLANVMKVSQQHGGGATRVVQERSGGTGQTEGV